jgi:streptomycin 6-kinase
VIEDSRIQRLIGLWNLDVDEVRESPSSFLVFARRNNVSVVAKILRRHSDEWCSSNILKAFKGEGMVRLLEESEGAVLLERILPGNPLTDLVLDARDDEATDILAVLIERMASAVPPSGCARVEEWAEGFERYLQSVDSRIARPLVRQAQDIYLQLCRSQGPRRLLHGDLHHGNVLFDENRGWLAIDPKGVIAEVEYEIGAIVRNPIGHPELFESREIVDRRIRRFERALHLNFSRTLGWAFAQAVLAAIWMWEDGEPSESMQSWLRLAEILRPSSV